MDGSYNRENGGMVSLISMVGRCRHLFYLMPFIFVLSISALVYMCDEAPAPPYPTMVDILHVLRVACTCITVPTAHTRTCTWDIVACTCTSTSSTLIHVHVHGLYIHPHPHHHLCQVWYRCSVAGYSRCSSGVGH